MFTNNYIALRHNLFFAVYQTSASNGISGKKYTAVDGSNSGHYVGAQDVLYWDIGGHLHEAYIRDLSVSDVSYSGVRFGTGSTPATKNDYTLESPITSGITINSKSRTLVQEDDGSYTAKGLYVLTNTTDEDINIYELGYFSGIQTASSTYKLVMMDRTVLTEPITIAAGETKLVEYKFKFNQTLNVEA